MLVYITDHLFKYQPKVVMGIFVIFGYLNDAFSLPSIQAFTPTLDIDAGLPQLMQVIPQVGLLKMAHHA